MATFSGCDRGFGETLSSRLALEGYTVYAGCLDLNSEGANRLSQYTKVHVFHVDVTSNVSVQKAAELIDLQQREKASILVLYRIYIYI